MKRAFSILTFVLALALVASSSLVSTITGHVQLGWGYDRQSANPNLSFNIYCATNLLQPAASWPLLTNIVSTAALNTNDAAGTNYALTLDLPPAQYFFIATASNFWGESSVTSNIVSTPPPPQPVNTLKIQKIP